MVRSMENESFYQSGTYFAPQMGIYAGWVAMTGSFAGGQVFTNQKEDVALRLPVNASRIPNQRPG